MPPDDKRVEPFVPLDLSFGELEPAASASERDLEETPAEGTDGASERLIEEHLARQAQQMLATLTPQEERTLRMRFGIGEEQPALDEVGQDFEITKQRIREIEARALAKLRHPSRSTRLEAFVYSSGTERSGGDDDD